jgi:hypothetical protein
MNAAKQSGTRHMIYSGVNRTRTLLNIERDHMNQNNDIIAFGLGGVCVLGE